MTFLFQPLRTGPVMRPRFPLSVAAVAISVTLLSGCALRPGLQPADVMNAARAGLPLATEPAAAPMPVMPPAALPVVAPVREPVLDLLVNNAPARDVFQALVTDTRYSMLMHPDVTGTLSVTLRGVTLTEALEAIRDVYGYDFKIEGRRITVYAPTLQTRMFTVNYPQSQRVGSTDLRLSAGSALQAGTGGVHHVGRLQPGPQRTAGQQGHADRHRGHGQGKARPRGRLGPQGLGEEGHRRGCGDGSRICSAGKSAGVAALVRRMPGNRDIL